VISVAVLVMATTTPEPPAPKPEHAAAKPKPGDSKLVAAMQDVRLKGSAQAVYFTLRGLGMPATEGSHGIPRIEIYAAKQPQLFRALRRLGLRRDGNRIVVTAKEDAPDRAVTAPTGSPLGSSELRKMHASDGFVQGATSSSFRSRRSNLSEEERQDFFAKNSYPKVMARREAYYHALTEFAEESGYFDKKKPSTPESERGLSKSASEPKVRQRVVVEDEPIVVSYQAPPSPTATSPKSGAVALPQVSSSWKMSRPRANVADQQAWCSRSCVPKVQRAKVDLTFSTYRVQSSAGRASERHLIRRMAKLREHQQMQEAERERAAAFLDGSIPPEPSLASLGTEGSTGGRGSRAGSPHVEEESSAPLYLDHEFAEPVEFVEAAEIADSAEMGFEQINSAPEAEVNSARVKEVMEELDEPLAV